MLMFCEFLALSPNFEAWRPPIFSCKKLLIMYIDSLPPHLRAFPLIRTPNASSAVPRDPTDTAHFHNHFELSSIWWGTSFILTNSELKWKKTPSFCIWNNFYIILFIYSQNSGGLSDSSAANLICTRLEINGIHTVYVTLYWRTKIHYQMAARSEHCASSCGILNIHTSGHNA